MCHLVGRTCDYSEEPSKKRVKDAIKIWRKLGLISKKEYKEIRALNEADVVDHVEIESRGKKWILTVRFVHEKSY